LKRSGARGGTATRGSRLSVEADAESREKKRKKKKKAIVQTGFWGKENTQEKKNSRAKGQRRKKLKERGSTSWSRTIGAFLKSTFKGNRSAAHGPMTPVRKY